MAEEQKTLEVVLELKDLLTKQLQKGAKEAKSSLDKLSDSGKKLEGLSKDIGAITKPFANMTTAVLGSSDELSTAMESMNDSMAKLFSAIADSGLLDLFVDLINNAIVPFIDELSKASEPVLQFIGVAAGIVGGLSPLLGFLGKLRVGFAALATVLSSPVVLGIGAAVGATALLVKNVKPLNDAWEGLKLAIGGTDFNAFVGPLTPAQQKAKALQDTLQQLKAGWQTLTGQQVAAPMPEGQVGPMPLSPAQQEGIAKAEQLRQKLTELRDALAPIFAAIGQAIQSGWQVVTQVLSNAAAEVTAWMQPVIAWFQQNWPLMQQTVQTTLNNIQAFWQAWGPAITAAWQTFWDGLVTAVSAVWEIIKGLVEVAFELIGGILRAGMQAFNGDWAGAWETIKQTFSQIWDTITDYAKKVLGILSEGFSQHLENAKQLWAETWDAIKTKLSEVWDGIVSTVSEYFANLITAFNEKVEEIKQKWSEGWEAVKSKASEIWTAIVSTVSEYFSNLITAFIEKIEEIKQKWAQGWESLKEILGSIWSGIIESVRSKFNDLIELLKRKASQMLDPFNWLRRVVVGNSIVPDMNDEIIADFRRAFGNIIGQAWEFGRELIGEWGNIAGSIDPLELGTNEWRADVADFVRGLQSERELYFTVGEKGLVRTLDQIRELEDQIALKEKERQTAGEIKQGLSGKQRQEAERLRDIALQQLDAELQKLQAQRESLQLTYRDQQERRRVLGATLPIEEIWDVLSAQELPLVHAFSEAIGHSLSGQQLADLLFEHGQLIPEEDQRALVNWLNTYFNADSEWAKALEIGGAEFQQAAIRFRESLEQIGINLSGLPEDMRDTFQQWASTLIPPGTRVNEFFQYEPIGDGGADAGRIPSGAEYLGNGMYSVCADGQCRQVRANGGGLGGGGG